MDKVINHLKQNKNEYILTALIFILAIVLRLVCLNNIGAIWYEEILSWHFAEQNSFIETIKYVVNQDIQMPLYFVLLHFWTKLFGDDATVMRYLSFVITLPLIPLTYLIARNLFNKTTAYFAAGYLAINTFCIYYCCETRALCINLLLAPIIAFAFCKMTDKFEKKYIILYVISLSALFYNFT